MSPFGAAGPVRVLGVFAHADDEVLGCGGAISRHGRRGDHVTVLVFSTSADSRGAAAYDRSEDLARAASVLGVADVRSLDLPDNRFDQVPLLELVTEIEALARTVEPAIVYTHSSAELSMDHERVARAAQTSFRPTAHRQSLTVLGCEMRSATDVSEPFLRQPFRPQVFVELDEIDVERKLAALRCYERELREWPQPRSEQAVETQARHRGAQIAARYAEAFELLCHVDRYDEWSPDGSADPA